VSEALIARRYRLVQPLGSGGMARVWLARDEVLRRDVAIKEVALPSGLTTDEREELINRTLREARAAARLSHPNVVQIYDVVHTSDQPWIVMEYIRSRSLQQIISQDGPVSPERAASIGLAVLSALTAAHQAGVLHRDVKPGNVLIADDDRVVLTDFGLATFDGGEGSVTRPGLVWASPEYVAPERARLGASTVEADMWSLGATLYAAVEGHSPFARTTAMATLTALATEKPAAPQHAGALKPVLSGLLRKDPKTRLGAGEVERLLRRVAGVPPRQRPKRVPRPRTEPLAIEAGRDSAAVIPFHSNDLPDLAREPTPELALRLSELDESATMIVSDVRPVRRRRSWLVALVTVLTVVAAGAALVYGVRQLDKSATTGVEPTVSATSPSAVVASLTGPRPGESALPEQFGYWRDPSGFRIAVPKGWLVSRQGNTVYFREPGGGARVLSVAQSDHPEADPLAETKREEQQGLAFGQLRHYQLITLKPLEFHGRGAQWKYLADDATGAQMFYIVLRFVTPTGRGYVISYVSSPFDQAGSTSLFDLYAPSFQTASK
jgi:eukaryotic-like serine/threonine-protein kinase